MGKMREIESGRKRERETDSVRLTMVKRAENFRSPRFFLSTSLSLHAPSPPPFLFVCRRQLESRTRALLYTFCFFEFHLHFSGSYLRSLVLPLFSCIYLYPDAQKRTDWRSLSLSYRGIKEMQARRSISQMQKIEKEGVGGERRLVESWFLPRAE